MAWTWIPRLLHFFSDIEVQWECCHAVLDRISLESNSCCFFLKLGEVLHVFVVCFQDHLLLQKSNSIQNVSVVVVNVFLCWISCPKELWCQSCYIGFEICQGVPYLHWMAEVFGMLANWEKPLIVSAVHGDEGGNISKLQG